jgi:hypothetical protein
MGASNGASLLDEVAASTPVKRNLFALNKLTDPTSGAIVPGE